MITITVLIPTKNRVELLKRALTSIFVQTVQPEEIIVVNDGSTDTTEEFLSQLQKTHQNLLVINRKENGGVNAARNQGIQAAKSDWVAFLDDDDEFVPDAVKIMKDKVSFLLEIYNVVYFNSKIHNDEGMFTGGFQFSKLKEKVDFYDPSYEETMTKWNLWRDCKQVIRRRLFLQERYKFPETVNGFESYTMSLVAKDGKGIRYYPDELTIIHQESKLQDRLSITAPKKNPWPLFILHYKQIFQHLGFYLRHPLLLLQKKMTMLKLLYRSVI